jgi:alkanesulfonate monooxygenase SsuD/methylene tetrahydromethanopterin reductase-like flavin-dependent oxidoreductase (luciferase family)
VRSIAGTADRLVDELGAFAALGFDEFIIPDFNLGRTPGARRERLELIRTEVLARL